VRDEPPGFVTFAIWIYRHEVPNISWYLSPRDSSFFRLRARKALSRSEHLNIVSVHLLLLSLNTTDLAIYKEQQFIQFTVLEDGKGQSASGEHLVLVGPSAQSPCRTGHIKLQRASFTSKKQNLYMNSIKKAKRKNAHQLQTASSALQHERKRIKRWFSGPFLGSQA
jgi:hypothetical protein